MTACSLGTWWRYGFNIAACARWSIFQELLLGQVYNRYSMQPTYCITDTTVLTWIMLKYARPWSTSPNVSMMLAKRSRNTWRRWLRTLLSFLLIITITSPRACWIAGEKMGTGFTGIILGWSMPIVIRARAMFFNPRIYMWKADITTGSGKSRKIGVSLQTIQFLIVISLRKIKYISYINNRFFL